MHTRSAVVRLVALLLGCGAPNHITRLVNTPPERGARGPFVAAFVSYPRGSASLSTPSGTAGWLADYLVASDQTEGVISLWENADSERAFHSDERVAHATVERFDVPVWIDNGHDTPADQQEVAFVSLPLPFFHPRGIVESRIVDRVPEYQSIPALDRKYFVLMEPARVGGIYLWRDEASARAYYDDKWHEGVTKKYGADAELRFFKVQAVIKP
jgi:hypothetical protein